MTSARVEPTVILLHELLISAVSNNNPEVASMSVIYESQGPHEDLFGKRVPAE